MRKATTILLALVMALSLAACGGGSQATNTPAPTEAPATPEPTPDPTPTPEPIPTKEELLTIAEEADANDLNNDCFDNLARAKQKYCNKTLVLKGLVKTVQEDYVELAGFYGATYLVDVYLPLDELVSLETGQSITVVGNTTEEIIDSSNSIAEYSFEYKHFQMPTAYLVKDRIEVVCVLKGVNKSYAPAYNVQIGSSNVYKLVYFANDVDTSALSFGQEVKISAKAINKNDSWRYYDAEIIE